MPGLRTVRQIAKPAQTSPSRPMLVDQLNPSGGIDRRQIRREERPASSARTRTLWLFNCCWDSDGTMDQARETELLSRALEHLEIGDRAARRRACAGPDRCLCRSCRPPAPGSRDRASAAQVRLTRTPRSNRRTIAASEPIPAHSAGPGPRRNHGSPCCIR